MREIPVTKTFVQINGRKIYSVIYGHGFPVIFLLGWLNNGDTYIFPRYIKTFVHELQNYQFHFVHLSNFYKSSYSKTPLTLNDYIEEVYQYARLHKFKTLHLAGHSAGGRIALGFALSHPTYVSKLVLLDSAGLSTRQPSQRHASFAHLSFSKFLATKAHRNILEQTYRNLFTTSLKSDIPHLKTPTLIIWGAKDRTIPPSHAHQLHSLIPNAQLEIIKNRDHMTIHDPEAFKHIFHFFNSDSQKRQDTAEYIPDLGKSFINPILRAYREKYLRLAGNITYRDFFTLLIPKAELDEINRAAVHTLQALQLFADYVIKKDPSLLNELQLGRIDIEGIKRRSKQTLFNYARIDTIYDGEKFWFIEVNARRPQMYEDADWFSYVSKASSGHATTEQNTANIAYSIVVQHRINHHEDEPFSIFLVSDNPKWDYPLSLANILKENCHRAKFINITDGVPQFSCVTYSDFIKDCTLKKHTLYFRDVKVDLIVLQNLCGGSSLFYTQGGIKSPLIREAYLSGTLEISSPPSALIIGSKLSLSFITDTIMQKKLKFSNAIVKSLQHFPETTLATDSTANDQNQETNYVLKSTKSISGGGVLMDGSASSPESLRYFVRQQKIEYGTRDIVIWRDRKIRQAGVTIEPFVVNNPTESKVPFVTGYSARAILQENLGRIKKYNPADNVPEILFGNVVGI